MKLAFWAAGPGLKSPCMELQRRFVRRQIKRSLGQLGTLKLARFIAGPTHGNLVPSAENAGDARRVSAVGHQHPDPDTGCSSNGGFWSRKVENALSFKRELTDTLSASLTEAVSSPRDFERLMNSVEMGFCSCLG